MKRAIPLMMLLSASLLAQSPEQGPDLERDRPTREQAWKLAEITRELGRIEERIAQLYDGLKLLGIISESGESLISMRASHQFAHRDTTLSEENVRIVWKNGAPAQFPFRLCTAMVRGLRTVVTIFQLDSVREGKEMREPDIHIISLKVISLKARLPVAVTWGTIS